MMILVTGGAASGKSKYAEALSMVLSHQEESARVYLATMKNNSREAVERIEKHREQRSGKGFYTVEWFPEKGGALESGDIEKMWGATVLLEDLSNLLANQMFTDSGNVDPSISGESLTNRIISRVDELNQTAGHLIVVTNEVFSDGQAYDETTEKYRKLLGDLNRKAAVHADVVVEVVSGIPSYRKGSLPETVILNEEDLTDPSEPLAFASSGDGKGE